MSKEKHTVKIRELTVRYRERRDLEAVPAESSRFSCPGDAARYLTPILSLEAVEVFVLLCLTTKHSVIAYHEVSRGTLDSALVHPREVFKVALLANAGCLILAHNHPSGDTAPSSEDFGLTRKLVEAGRLLGVEIVDHIIIGGDVRYYSFKESGRL